MNIIEITNARVYRGSNVALDEFSLTLPFGEHHAILGANGAGKTSFLKLMMRELHPVVDPNHRFLVLDQERPTIQEVRENLGIVSQDFQDAYQPHVTALDVVVSGFFGSIGIHQHLVVTDDLREQARAMLVELQIDDLADRQYFALSTGQQRRLILARALIHEPKALILDEPTNGLDLNARFWFLNTMRRLANTGTTIILVTHDPLEVIPEISKVSLLKRGRVLYSGLKADVLTEEALGQTYDAQITVSEIQGYYHLSPK